MDEDDSKGKKVDERKKEKTAAAKSIRNEMISDGADIFHSYACLLARSIHMNPITHRWDDAEQREKINPFRKQTILRYQIAIWLNQSIINI